MKDLHTKETDALFEAVLSLKNTDECYKFFVDVCTPKELEALAQRFAVARLLDEGKNYNDISAETGASSATICRVNKCLQYNDGYHTVLDRLTKEDGK